MLKQTNGDVVVSGNFGSKWSKPSVNSPSVGNPSPKFKRRATLELESDKIFDTINRGILDQRVFQKESGQRVFIEKLAPGRFNGVKMNKDGSFPQTMKDWSLEEMRKLGQDEKWPLEIRLRLEKDDYK